MVVKGHLGSILLWLDDIFEIVFDRTLKHTHYLNFIKNNCSQNAGVGGWGGGRVRI